MMMKITTALEPLVPNPNRVRERTAMEFLLRQSLLPLEEQLANCYTAIELHGTPTFWGSSVFQPDAYYKLTRFNGQDRVHLLLRRDDLWLLAVYDGAGSQWNRRIVTCEEREMLPLLPGTMTVRPAALKEASAKQLEVVRKLLKLGSGHLFPGPLLNLTASRVVDCIVTERKLVELRTDALQHWTESRKEAAA